MFHNLNPEKKFNRNPFEIMLQLHNQLPNEVKYLNPKTFKRKLKTFDISYTPESWNFQDMHNLQMTVD